MLASCGGGDCVKSTFNRPQITKPSQNQPGFVVQQTFLRIQGQFCLLLLAPCGALVIEYNSIAPRVSKKSINEKGT